jgi:F-type H+-transporting ATPase subunit a
VEGLGEKVAELLHELSSQPLHGIPVLTNYMFFLLVALVLTLVFFLVASRKMSMVPKGLGNVAEAGLQFVRDSIVVDVIGPEGAKYLPFVGTVFFFILFNNLLGLVPGFKPGTGTMGTTVTWAVMVFIVYNGIGMKKHGVWGYIKSFYPKGIFWLLAGFVMFLEIVSHCIRPLTLSVRLFANMYAGHVILGIFSIFAVLLLQASGAAKAIAVLPVLLQIAMYAFELFVAVVQAYVFAILTSVYISGAVHAGEH